MRVLMGHRTDGAWDHLAALLPGWEITSCPPAELAGHLDGVDVVCPIMAPVGPDVLAAGSFGLVQQYGAGTERVDVPAATAHGVWVARLPADLTGNADSVAELAVLHVLAGVRRLGEARSALHEGRWASPVAAPLFGSTVLVVGLGAVGLAVTRRLAGFDVRVTGLRAHTELGAPEGVAQVAGPGDLHAAVAEADVVVCCAPLDQGTRSMFDAAAFGAMKSGTVFVNVARGGLVDEAALLEALESRRVAAAGLDVFAGEPDEHDGPLQRHPRVIGTPHIAGVTRSALQRSAELFADNLRRFERGRPPRWVVNEPTDDARQSRR